MGGDRGVAGLLGGGVNGCLVDGMGFFRALTADFSDCYDWVLPRMARTTRSFFDRINVIEQDFFGGMFTLVYPTWQDA
mgnify:CR=1 FL=1